MKPCLQVYTLGRTHYILHVLTFIIESIYPIYAGTLVVSSKEKEVLRIFDLVRQQ